MPRQSAAAAAMPPVPHAHATRLSPPSDLDPLAVAVWCRIVASCAPTHFNPADGELLRAFVEAATLSQEAYREMRAHGRVLDGRPSPWLVISEKATRTMSALAPRLRLGPSARTDPKTTARQMNGRPASIYSTLGWDDEEEETRRHHRD